PRRSPRAPAKDDSTTPALGLGWAPASSHHVHETETSLHGAQEAIKAASKRAPGRLSRSSRRAEAQPNRSYRALRWPTMASSVLTARWANRPGTPATAPQRRGATTASAVFSATDSTTARDTSTVSNALVSRPTRDLSRRRAPGRSSCSNSTRTAAASRSRERPPSPSPGRSPELAPGGHRRDGCASDRGTGGDPLCDDPQPGGRTHKEHHVGEPACP